MRRDTNTRELINVLTAVIVGSDSTGCTANGASVDSLGFSDVLLIATMGQIYGTATTTAELVVSLSESDASTGPFTVISNGAINGTCTIKVNVIGHTAVTTPANYQKSLFETLGGNRKRYLSAIATVKGTSAKLIGGPVSVSVLLGTPMSTLYVAKPTSVGTGNTAFFGAGGGSYFLVP